MRLAKGLAIIEGREFVTPDDLIAVSNYCLAHRMILHTEQSELVLEELLQAMDI